MQYPTPPKARVYLTPIRLTKVPPKNPKTAKVEYRAVFCGEALVPLVPASFQDTRQFPKQRNWKGVMMMAAARRSRVFGTHHLVSQSGVLLPTTPQSRERIEHAGAQEADEGHHAQLKLGRGIPRERP